MTAQETFLANGAETTLSSTLSAGATTINVTSSAAFPSTPFYAVIDPDVDAKREVVLVDSSKTATTFVLSAASKRGQDGTTDIEHSAGAKIACVVVAAHFTDLNDRIDAVPTDGYRPGGTDVAVVDGGTGASDAATARANLGAQAQSAILDATTASFTTTKDTKLTGIESGADVTDATNVAAAGAVMESDATTAAMSFVVDEDDMVSNSATKVPTQQSVKAYVDANAGGGLTTVIKTVGESVTSSTTLQNDDELFAALSASTTYRFDFSLLVSCGDGGADAKMKLTVPSGASYVVAPVGPATASSTTGDGLWRGTVTGFAPEELYFGVSGSSGVPVFVRLYGRVTVGATAGNLQLQWAQNVSSTSALTIEAGSTLAYEAF